MCTASSGVRNTADAIDPRTIPLDLQLQVRVEIIFKAPDLNLTADSCGREEQLQLEIIVKMLLIFACVKKISSTDYMTAQPQYVLHKDKKYLQALSICRFSSNHG